MATQTASAPAVPPVSLSIPMRLISANGTVIHFPPSVSNTWLIGREDPVNDIHPDIDLTPYDFEQTVSRRHARIALAEGGQPTLISITATNWTKVNGARLALHQPVPLFAGDRIEMGRCVVTFDIQH